VIVKTLEEAPTGGDTHWSTRSMAKAVGLNQTATSRIWRAFGIKPHLVDTWKLSTDPQFIDKVRDIVGLYLDPPQCAMVLAVDEKTQMQALDRPAPVLPMMPAVPGRTTRDYIRHGTTSLVAALDVATGTVIGQHQRRHRHQESLHFLKTIDKNTPPELDLHLICCDYATHKTQRSKPGWPRTPIPPALHPDLLVLVQHGRTLVRRADQPQTAPLHPTTASKNSKPTSPPGSRHGTTTRNPLYGPKPPTRSWPTSRTT
jgi:hypothetical protein